MIEFIKCLQAYLKGEKLNKIEDDKDLIKLALEQSLQTILYPVYNDKSYKKFYIGWVVKQEEFLSLQKEITYIFNTNNINHLYFKGSVLCNLYDDPSIRTRGDIDVFVSSSDLAKTKKLLLENNFELDYGDNLHHINFNKNNISIELHFNLYDEEVSDKWVKYFINPFNLSINISNCQYQLDDTNHLLYCIAHFAKHLRQGAGFRYILDFYYMFEKTTIDYNKLQKGLKELQLDVLYNNILNVLYYLTNKRYDEFEIMNCDFFIEYMLQNGIHGNSKEDNSGVGIVKENKGKYIRTRLFLLNKEYRVTIYPKLGSKVFLYPLCLIIHWFHLITSGFRHKFKTFIRIIFGKNKKKDLFKKLGI